MPSEHSVGVPDPTKVLYDETSFEAQAFKQCRWGRRTDCLAYECVTCGAQVSEDTVLEGFKDLTPLPDLLRWKCPAPGRVSVGGCGKAPESHFAHIAEHVRMLQTLPIQLPELRWSQKLRYWLRGKRAPTAGVRWAEMQRRARQHLNDHRMHVVRDQDSGITPK